MNALKQARQENEESHTTCIEYIYLTLQIDTINIPHSKNLDSTPPVCYFLTHTVLSAFT